MSKVYISINQLADYSAATEASKKKIIKQQKIVDKLRIPWYQRAKGAIRRYLKNVSDTKPIEDAIAILKAKVPESDRQKRDRGVSIEALELMKKLRLPKLLRHLEYEVIVSDEKTVTLANVDIIVAPEIIIKAKYEGRTIYGGVKIHICKGKPFNLNQATYVAVAIHEFLRKKVAKAGQSVLPELCLCLDVFAERIVPAPDSKRGVISEVKNVCEEIEKKWSAA